MSGRSGGTGRGNRQIESPKPVTYAGAPPAGGLDHPVQGNPFDRQEAAVDGTMSASKSEGSSPRLKTLAYTFEILLFLGIVAIAVPAFFPSGLHVTGLQGLTPEKVILPLLCVATYRFVVVRRGWREVITPFSGAIAFLVGWFLVGVFVNRSHNFVYNIRAWSWLVLDFGLLVAVQHSSRTERGRRHLATAAGIAVLLVAALGFIEVAQLPGLDPFFRIFRPEWGRLGLHAPGPAGVLELHTYLGGKMRLMSTLSNDSSWFLAVGSVFFAVLMVFAKPSRFYRLVWFGVGYGVSLLALLLTLERAAVVVIALGLAALTLLGIRTGRIRRVALVWLTSGFVLFVFSLLLGSTASVLRTKFNSLITLIKAPAAHGVAKESVGHGIILVSAGNGVAKAPEDREVTRAPAYYWDVGGHARESVAVRLSLWRVAVAMSREHPIFGVGFTNFRPRLYEPGPYRDMFRFASGEKELQDPHNFFLWLAAAGGIPALGSVVLLLAFALMGLGREVLSSRDLCPWKAGLLVVWISLLGFMLLGFTLLSPTAQPVFAILVGLTGGLLDEQGRTRKGNEGLARRSAAGVHG